MDDILQKRPIIIRYSAKETYNLKEPTNLSHPIVDSPLDYREASAQELYWCRALVHPQKSPICVGLFFKRDLGIETVHRSLPLHILSLTGSLDYRAKSAKEPYLRRAIFQKRPRYLNSLHVFATPFPQLCCAIHSAFIVGGYFGSRCGSKWSKASGTLN